MGLLASSTYDPAVAVTKATSALLAMTAMDTTNLRCAFNAPTSGNVLVRLQGVIHGATTAPQIMLGVLSGATVVRRVAPELAIANIAATTLVVAEAVFAVSGLTPGGSYTWDAAYGVETVVASSAIKYGGPDNATANDNFGAFIFEVYEA